MDIYISDATKSRIVRYGRFRIFGRDRSELNSDLERVQRFDACWQSGLHEALLGAIRENRLVEPHVARKRVQESYIVKNPPNTNQNNNS